MGFFAGIVVNKETMKLDRLFTYKIPENLRGVVKEGSRVKVPFGIGNNVTQGFVMSIFHELSENDNIDKIKSIICLCDKVPILRDVDLKIIKDMRERYLCTYIECIRVFIPSGILKGQKFKEEDKVFLGRPLDGKYLNEKYENIYNIVYKNNGSYNKSALSKKFNISLSSINTMLKYGFLSLNSEIVARFDERDYKEYCEKKLNYNQQIVFNDILSCKQNKFLLHGITGSGKTEIYMHLVSHMLKEGKDSIVLIPEISLTPQMVERFKGRFGKDIAVFHSRLSEGERFDQWMRVFNSEVKVAIGARSAIFLPFKNLGLIVIDEEHENSYKSDSDPKYNAKEIAFLRNQYENCTVLLGSATPSVVTYNLCENNKIKLLKLSKRADGASLPKAEVVDMREELIKGNRSILSFKLQDYIKECLDRKEQIILFLNRRGYSTFVSCRKCGYVFKCKNCDISLTYHSRKNFLSCHYCGYIEPIQRVCPKCGSKYVKYFGTGTEKLEEEIKRIYGSARVLRMDYDTTRTKGSYEKIYTSFKEGRGDILIGTQMVAKGLDFKNVTLVGVITADLSLNIPDFRSQERTFQLITQVSGRAGRSDKPGRVIIQTYMPEEYSIQKSIENDYEGFYNKEIFMRKLMNYPPFSNILVVYLSSKEESIIKKVFDNIYGICKNKFENNKEIQILGPSPCDVLRINEFFRWKLIFKGNISKDTLKFVKEAVYDCVKNDYNSIRVSLDINPNSLI